MKKFIFIFVVFAITNLFADSIQLIKETAKPITKKYIGYFANKEEALDENLIVFVSYGEEYRPSGLDIIKYSFKIGDQTFPAYKSKISFSANVKDGIVNYGSNESLKFLYKVKPNMAYNLYFYENGSLKLIKEYKSSDIKSGKLNLHSALNLYENGSANAVVDKPTFVIIPANLAANIDSASKPKELDLKYVAVDGIPFDAQTENQFGPNSHSSMYGTPPGIVTVKNANGGLSIAWKESTKNILHLMELNSSLSLVNELKIKMKFPKFGGFAKDEDGNYFVLFAKDNKDGDFSSNVQLIKFNSRGQESGTYSLSIDRKNYDVMTPISAATCRVVYANGLVAVHMGKTQHKNKGDGLNHQSGILFVVDSKTMKFKKEHSTTWTASHSFDQRLIHDGETFVNLDLGDNFPRGFSIAKNLRAKVIFTYKTQHYPNQNRSNDNNTYSELGGLAVSDSGYVVLGSSEKSFDNKKTGTYLNESRNLFMLLVDKDFSSKATIKVDGKDQGNMVSPEVVISQGEPSKKIFYHDFGGGKNHQQRTGVIWLTNYTDKQNENVARPKLVKLSNDKFMAIYEKWKENSYDSTYYLMFNSQGAILKEPTKLGPFRLSRGDDVIEWNGKAVWITGQKSQKNLKIHVLEP